MPNFFLMEQKSIISCITPTRSLSSKIVSGIDLIILSSYLVQGTDDLLSLVPSISLLLGLSLNLPI